MNFNAQTEKTEFALKASNDNMFDTNMPHAQPDKRQPPAEQLARRTWGEFLHNELTYRGVDWVINTATAVGFSYWAARTKFGKTQYFDRVTKGIDTALKPIKKDPVKRKEWAENGTGFVNIAIGGLAIVPVMMKLESHDTKRGIVRWFDRIIYGEERVANDEWFAIRYDQIADEPKKDFGTGMLARGIVLAPMITAHMRYKPFMKKWMYDQIGDRTKWACAKAGFQPQGLMTRQPTWAQDTDWDFLHETLGMDAGLTFIYSFAHEWTYKALAALKHEKPDVIDRPANSNQPDEPITSKPPAPKDSAPSDSEPKDNETPKQTIDTQAIAKADRLTAMPKAQVSHG